MEDKEKFKYISLDKHQGKSDLYNIVKIETESFDSKTAPLIKEELVEYFDKNVIGLQGTKNALDMSNVEYMNSSGLAAILICNRLSLADKNRKYGIITLLGCKKQPSKLLDVSQIDGIINIVEDREYL